MVQMIGGYANKAIVIVQGLLLIPFYLHFIGVRMYGLWLASGGILAWLSFMDIGLGAALIQRVSSAYGEKEYSKAGSYFLNGMLVYSLLGFFFLLAAVGASCVLPRLFNAAPNEAQPLQYCFLLAAVASVANILSEGLRGFAQALLRPLVPHLSLALCRLLGLGGILIFLFEGYGLWSIPLGLLLNALPLFALNLFYSFHLFRRLGGKCIIERKILKDYYTLSPSLFAGRFGHAVVARIEPTLIAATLSPQLATAFVITRRVADIIEMLLQVIFASLFPSFAHIYAQDREKAVPILRKMVSFYFSAGLVGFGAYVAGNHAFVNLWVGAANFSGQDITIAVAMGLLMMVAQSFFSGMLIGMGDIVRPSWLILAEAVLRFILMAMCLRGFGLLGLPIAMFVSCGLFSVIFYLRMSRQVKLGMFRSRGWFKPLSLLFMGFAASVWLGVNTYNIESWALFVPYMAVVIAVLCSFAWTINPDIASLVLKGKEKGLT